MMETKKMRCVICRQEGITEDIAQPDDFEYFVQTEREFRVLRCKNCKSEFIEPRPTIEELVSFYPDDYHAYNEDHGFVAQTLVSLRAQKRAKDLLRLVGKEPVWLFDVGAGDCRQFDALKKYGRFEFAGVEINSDMVQAAHDAGYDVHQGDLEQMDISAIEQSFDVVTMYQLVEHVIDPRRLMTKAFQLLRPGGYIFGQLPCRDSFEYALFGRYWAGYHYPRHLQMLTKKGLYDLCNQAGFVQIKVETALHLQMALSAQNVIVDITGIKRQGMKFGKIPIYSLLLMGVAPFCILEYALGRGGMMNFMARRPLSPRADHEKL